MYLRHRIALNMLSIVIVAGTVSVLIGGYLLWSHLTREAQNRVWQNLNAARMFYNQRVQEIESSLRYTVLGQRFSQAVAAQDIDYVAPRLNAIRKSASLDMLSVTDADGRVILRGHRPGSPGGSAADDPMVASVLNGKDLVSGTVVVPIEKLAREHPSLAGRARIRILPTPRAKSSAAEELDSGLMLCGAAAIRDPAGSLVGVLKACELLSHNHKLVDQVQNTVFRDERYGGKPLGATTIFQGDVRISTTALKEDGSRAIGTRVSAEVYDAVFVQGKTWVGPAWVVNESYLTSYAPIRDTNGVIVGMLGIGVLERKFRDTAWNALAAFTLVIVAAVAAVAAVAWKLASSISEPVTRLAEASSVVAQGDFSLRLPVESSDEIGSLARAFNTMAKSLKERDELLKEQTRQHLTRSERLASIGRLAAGVAHEINNPLTGVLTFAHMLLKNAPEDSQEREDLETIIDASTRCRDIVRGLLNFSRQSEPQRALSGLNDVLGEALNLTRNQASVIRVSVIEEMDATLRPLVIDPDQIQEVAVNLVVNAIDAMPDGGNLIVRTRSVTEDGKEWAEFEISDSGCGISEEDLEHIFDPFFTTKEPGKGTGLGLAISYGIVGEHGGHINVSSELAHGTTVTVRLPVTTEREDGEPEGRSAGGGC